MKSPVVIQFSGPLNEKQIKEIFAVPKEHSWYKAVVQIIEQHRQERISTAASFMNENNAIGCAGGVAAWDILNTLLIDFESRRVAANR